MAKTSLDGHMAKLGNTSMAKLPFVIMLQWLNAVKYPEILDSANIS